MTREVITYGSPSRRTPARFVRHLAVESGRTVCGIQLGSAIPDPPCLKVEPVHDGARRGCVAARRTSS